MHTKGSVSVFNENLFSNSWDTADTQKHFGSALHILISPKRVAPQCEETIGRCVLLQGQGGTEERRWRRATPTFQQHSTTIHHCTVQAFVRVQPNISSLSSSCLPFYISSRVSNGWSTKFGVFLWRCDSMSCEQSIPLTVFVSSLCSFYLCFLRLFAKRLMHRLANDYICFLLMITLWLRH